MHNPDFTLQLLVNLALHYPQAGRTPAQLQILAEDWAEDLAEFSPETVERAVKQYRRNSAYFPTVADIWAHCDELRRGEARPMHWHFLSEQRRSMSVAKRAPTGARRSSPICGGRWTPGSRVGRICP